MIYKQGEVDTVKNCCTAMKKLFGDLNFTKDELADFSNQLDDIADDLTARVEREIEQDENDAATGDQYDPMDYMKKSHKRLFGSLPK